MEAQPLLGRRVSILSIDGGGVRGLIPSKILEFLEQELQKLDGLDARIVDYFDVIAGTSTGGIIASLLALPNEKGHPRYTAKDASLFYIRDAPNIFASRRSAIPLIQPLLGPKYDANGLEKILRDVCQDLKMKDMLTDVVMPTFDIKLMQPTFFSTCEAKREESKNAFLRDVLRGTTAAPTYFAPTLFYTTDQKGERKAFNLVDGGVGVNNPTYHAIVHVQREIFRKNAIYADRLFAAQDPKSLLVLSLGTGSIAESYDSTQAARWGFLPWIINNGKVPLLDMTTGATADVVDFNLSVLFHTFQCPQNYLRIQPLNLSGDVTSIDNVHGDNIQHLQEISEEVLDQHVRVMNMDTGAFVSHPEQGTNKEALARFAKVLAEECKARKKHSIHK